MSPPLWLYGTPNNITLRIDSMYLGEKRGGYTFRPPTISMDTYREIVQIICQKRPQPTTSWDYVHLRRSKVNGEIVRSQRLLLTTCGLYVCPECHYGNCCPLLCGRTTKVKMSSLMAATIPRYLRCRRCRTMFMTDRDKLPPCVSWQCVHCENRFDRAYAEFVRVMRNPPTTTPPPLPPLSSRSLYDRLDRRAQNDLNNDPSTLSYSLYVRNSNGDSKLVPPLALLADEHKTTKFYDRLLSMDPASVKTNFGSVIDRMKKGKYSAVRQHSHNTRYVKSGRAVIVPYGPLEPDECVLPATMWRRLECPRTVLAHRYPTLNERNFTVHRVVATWIFPVVGIPTSIVRGNNADFDGDAMQIIPMLDYPSEAEALTLFHPADNMIVARGDLRVAFDHDEVLTLYRVLGVDGDALHEALRDLAVAESSRQAYAVFCHLRHWCRRLWETDLVFALTYGDVLQFVPKREKGKPPVKMSFGRFLSRVFRPVNERENVLKLLIRARSSRFRVEHLWQMVGVINSYLAPSSNFLGGMKRHEFVRMAMLSRMALIKDVAYAGYGYIKLLYCTKTLVLGYDGRVYADGSGQLVAGCVEDLFPRNS